MKRPEEHEITINLDELDLERFGTSMSIARINVIRNGKRETFRVDMVQHAMMRSPTIRMIATARNRDIYREIQVTPLD